MKVPANEFGPKGIRVNSIHPKAVRTDMVLNEATYGLFRPDLQHPALDDAAAAVA